MRPLISPSARASSFLPGLPLRTRILTRRSWLTHDEVQPGDETIGYDPETRLSTWTRIARVVHYQKAETVRFGNAYWSVECTPEHRWLMEHVSYESPVGVTSGRHGYVPGRKEVIRGEALTEFRCRRAKHRVILARVADLGGSLPITVNEAALLGWIAGDGTVAEPRDYWRPRKPELAATAKAPYGYRRDGVPKKNRSGRPRESGLRHKVSSLQIRIVQAKPEHFSAIELACSDAPNVGRHVQMRGGSWRDCHYWVLGADYTRDLLTRAGHPKRDAVQQVLAMSAEQRAAWLKAIIASEGTCEGTKTTIYQDDGPIADAIELAIYLSGKRPSRTKDKRGEGKGGAIRITTPHVGGPQRRSFTTEAGRQDVWCVTTALGTWTAEQDGRVFLTGNSRWGSSGRSSAAPPSPGAQWPMP